MTTEQRSPRWPQFYKGKFQAKFQWFQWMTKTWALPIKYEFELLSVHGDYPQFDWVGSAIAEMDIAIGPNRFWTPVTLELNNNYRWIIHWEFKGPVVLGWLYEFTVLPDIRTNFEFQPVTRQYNLDESDEAPRPPWSSLEITVTSLRPRGERVAQYLVHPRSANYQG